MAKQPIVSIAFRKDIQQKQTAATILAADIGGTKTNIALYRLDENGLHQLSSEKRYLSKDYHSLTDIIHDFTGGKLPDRISAAVAGPVIEGKSKLTNLSWQLDSQAIALDLKVPVCFINDLQATPYGLAGLEAKRRATLAAGATGVRGNIWSITPGTCR